MHHKARQYGKMEPVLCEFPSQKAKNQFDIQFCVGLLLNYSAFSILSNTIAKYQQP